MALRVVLDAGHGGANPGAVYEGRQEKDDALDLTLAVGDILEERGVDVVYTRTTDVDYSVIERAEIANNSNADFFLSIHRNATGIPNASQGAEMLVYDTSGIKIDVANNILYNLEAIGFLNRGITERPNLAVLRRTRMPAVLAEVGFIDSDYDNELFDTRFDDIADAIAAGILEAFDVGATEAEETTIYRVQVGAYKNSSLANQLLTQLIREGYPAVIVNTDGYYRVQVGAFSQLDNATRMENQLRRQGYSTYIAT